MAQSLDVIKKIKRLDSLMSMYHSNYDSVEREADELYRLLTTKYTGSEYNDFQVKVMLHKAQLYLLKEEFNEALQIALEASDKAKEYQLPEKIYHSSWMTALTYEITDDFASCKKYLDEAYTIYKQHKLDSVYSVYCIRMSSYYRLTDRQDSALHFAHEGLNYAQTYNNSREITDAYMLLGMLLKDNHNESVRYSSLTAKRFIERKDFASAALQFSNAAVTLYKQNRIKEAFMYSDSALLVVNKSNIDGYSYIYRNRSNLFEAVGNIDSAHYYFRKYHDIYLSELEKIEKAEIRKITEQYESGKKEAVIKSREQQLFFIGSLLAVIILGSVMLIRKNRQINKQNRIINTQLGELTKTLEQKQVLLSELQHRVKNNLQHVISILEIQKESVDFNNIDELIRGNQNRIHSMALLHKKLNVADNVNEVDLKRYVTELVGLVKESYDNHKKKISLHIKCDIESISIEKALPLGLIITELVSNSMKHAFKKRSAGIIRIEITKDEILGQNKLYYSDNGEGFDFNVTSEKGLGQEIIKGLIDQLDGNVEAKNDNGFELTVDFV
ncbi:MAG TPA: sensor histidine kinase [Sphingobacterium sp.]|nr:sensor histidine kinase [Sphingobacterium sp.]